MTGRLVTNANTPIRPFDQNAAGGALGEGGGIVTLESVEAFEQRGGDPRKLYAEVVGFGASQTVHRETKNRTPDAEGRGIVNAVRAALREADLDADAIDVVIPFGLGHPDWDGPEAAALRTILGDRLGQVPVVTPKAHVGNLGAGSGGYDLCLAAQILKTQTLPKPTDRPAPLPGLTATTADKLDVALVFATGLGGQNTAIILKKI